jgi:hypothetical protein
MQQRNAEIIFLDTIMEYARAIQVPSTRRPEFAGKTDQQIADDLAYLIGQRRYLAACELADAEAEMAVETIDESQPNGFELEVEWWSRRVA